jgi:DNA polymerase-3 subunit epsilon
MSACIPMRSVPTRHPMHTADRLSCFARTECSLRSVGGRAPGERRGGAAVFTTPASPLVTRDASDFHLLRQLETLASVVSPRTRSGALMQLPFPLDRPLAFFDLETTGLNPRADRIVELALVRVAPDGDVLERVRRFNPGVPIPAEASRVHGITDADVADEPPFSARARSLLELLNPCDLAGFNIRRFDLPMLLAEFRRAGLDLELKGRRIVDIQAIFHREERRDLSAAARFYLEREHAEAHSALSDTRTAAAVLAAQLGRYGHLPRDLQGLHAYCDEVAPFETEVDRWFQRTEAGLVFRRGRHRGKALNEIAALERDYLDWMLSAEDMDEEVLALVREAIAYRPGQLRLDLLLPEPGSPDS